MLRVYLRGVDLEGFELDKQRPSVLGHCRGFHFCYENDRWYVNLGDCAPLPSWLEEVAEEYSLYESLPRETERESGIYHFNTAEAEVQSVLNDEEARKRICIRAKCIEDVRQLLRQIKAGTIRPDENYEDPQCGLSRRELEAKIVELRDYLQAINASSEEFKAAYEGLGSFHDELVKGGAFFLSRRSVVKRITKILHPQWFKK